MECHRHVVLSPRVDTQVKPVIPALTPDTQAQVRLQVCCAPVHLLTTHSDYSFLFHSIRCEGRGDSTPNGKIKFYYQPSCFDDAFGKIWSAVIHSWFVRHQSTSLVTWNSWFLEHLHIWWDFLWTKDFTFHVSTRSMLFNLLLIIWKTEKISRKYLIWARLPVFTIKSYHVWNRSYLTSY